MKNKHIGQLKAFTEKGLINYKNNTNSLIFDRTTELTLYIKKEQINIHEFNIGLMDNGNIKIDCCFYNDELFVAYKNKNKIRLIEEKGILMDYNDMSKLLNYIRTYKRYRIKSVTGNSKTDGHWVYILKPCLF